MNKKTKLIKMLKVIFYYTFIIIKKIIYIIPGLFKALQFILSGIINSFKRLLRFSITFKITFVYTFILSILLFLVSVGILFGFKFFLIEQTRENVDKNSEIIVNKMKNISEIPEKLIYDTVLRENIEVNVFDINKKLIYTSIKDNEYESYYIPNINYSEVIRDTNNYEKLILNKGISVNDKIYYLQFSKNLEEENEYFFILLTALVVLDIIIIIITMVVASKVSKKMLRPVDDMTKIVKAINIKNLDTRLNVNGSHDELKELAQTFNEMFDRIQESYERQNQFVSDASHELRTPIAVIQGYVNLLNRWGKNDKEVLEESIIAIKSESQNMKELVEKLLFLARADKKTQKVEKSEFYLDELVDEVFKETKLIDTNHEIINKTDEKILIFADRKLLKQTLRIFIDNSIKFTAEKGSITVNAYSNKNKAILVIEDTGIGIPKEDIPYVFNRFYRSDKSRSKDKGGTGLGLSIAKWIIAQHKGTINIKSVVDFGTKISISIPIKNKATYVTS
ncbi:HAMP domain-containing sensor histidine kinase [Clostridium aestuarii]|uniref:histidine kinase n=1 Tax=Clostridium aestuarii TaxID=338193 RepID=A0ABT4CV60_9CLOT|nr:HAMP domain-containing sensor histidine kinase [Clostridium aestuarii]MCY6482859.1 HAMP domain-containing sensor histidine kinase [Clostridium aestuarii]